MYIIKARLAVGPFFVDHEFSISKLPPNPDELKSLILASLAAAGFPEADSYSDIACTINKAPEEQRAAQQQQQQSKQARERAAQLMRQNYKFN